MLRFEPDGGFTLGLMPPEGSAARTESATSQPAQVCWRYRPGRGFEPVGEPPEPGARFGWSTNGFDGDRAEIVPIDFDGWNARRQIWVRPGNCFAHSY